MLFTSGILIGILSTMVVGAVTYLTVRKNASTIRQRFEVFDATQQPKGVIIEDEHQDIEQWIESIKQ